MQKVTPFLWFDDKAEEAVNFYGSVFKDVKIDQASRYPDDSPGPAGQVMTISFQLFGHQFIALNGGPVFNFNPAVSFVVSCDSQEEIDTYWDKLLDGGQTQQCGWITDRYGLSWQIVPRAMGKLMSEGTPEQSQRVMQAMLGMVKLDLGKLQSAFDGE